MKKIGFILAVAGVLCLASGAGAVKNANGKWALHYAGPHDAKANTCDFVLQHCDSLVTTCSAPDSAYYDVYVIAVDVAGIAGTRYGITCDGTVYFQSWTLCTPFSIPETGWPACDKGIAQTWSAEQPGPFLTLGILEVYIYGDTNTLSATTDPRVGFAEWCDGSEPKPICYQIDGSDTRYFGVIGFNGQTGFSPCGIVPTQATTWGQVKTLYR